MSKQQLTFPALGRVHLPPCQQISMVPTTRSARTDSHGSPGFPIFSDADSKQPPPAPLFQFSFCCPPLALGDMEKSSDYLEPSSPLSSLYLLLTPALAFGLSALVLYDWSAMSEGSFSAPFSLPPWFFPLGVQFPAESLEAQLPSPSEHPEGGMHDPWTRVRIPPLFRSVILGKPGFLFIDTGDTDMDLYVLCHIFITLNLSHL